MKLRTLIAIALIAFVPSVSADAPLDGLCIRKHDAYVPNPGFAHIVVVETDQSSRQGVYTWAPDNALQLASGEGMGWLEFSGSCSLLEEVKNYVRCQLGGDSTNCDDGWTANPNIRYFVV
jgi:hypothetical protein